MGTALYTPRIWNIYIYGNYLYDNRFATLAYIYADNIYIWSNLMINNYAGGHVSTSGAGGDPPTDVYLYNNTIAYNGNESNNDRGGILHVSGTNHVNKNNILYNNRWTNNGGQYNQIFDSTSATWDYNTLYFTGQIPSWYYGGADRTLAYMQGIGQEAGAAGGTGGEIADPNFIDPDSNDYRLSSVGTLGQDIGACFSVDLSNGDVWFEGLSGYGRYIAPCLNDALDPNNTDWTTTPPTVATVDRDTYGWARGAYAFGWLISNASPADGAEGQSDSLTIKIGRAHV